MRFPLLSLPFAFAALSTTASLGNLLGDSGFETDLEGNPPETSWLSFGEAYVELDGDQQSGGAKALKLFQSFTGAPNFSGAVQMVTVTAGVTYKLTGLIRNGPDPSAETPDPLQGSNYGLPKIEWFDAFDGVTAAHEDNVRAVVRESSVPGEWLEFELIATAPDDAVEAQIVLLHGYLGTGDEGGSTWFDDIVFEVTTDPLPADKTGNLLVDGGFDVDPDMNWIPFGNSFFETSRFGNPTLAFRGTSAKMFQTFSGPDTNVSGIFQNVPVTPGVSYLYTGRARNGAVGEDFMGVDNRALIKIEWLDASDTPIAGTAVEDPVLGQIDNFSTPGPWFELAISGVAPPEAVEAQVLILHVAEGVEGGGSSWFDDLCFQVGRLPVAPQIVDITYVPGDPSSAILEWTSSPDCSYTLEKSLNGETWSPVEVGVLDAGGTATATDPAAIEAEALYRVLAIDN